MRFSRDVIVCNSFISYCIKELYTLTSRENLKLAPEKSFYMLLKVKFLGHEIGNNTIKPIPSKIEAIKRIPSPKEKKDVMQFLGSVNFYSKFIEKLHINLKPLYTLLHDDVKFQWTPELEKIIQNVKNAMTSTVMKNGCVVLVIVNSVFAVIAF